jgi:hypothetical protein
VVVVVAAFHSKLHESEGELFESYLVLVSRLAAVLGHAGDCWNVVEVWSKVLGGHDSDNCCSTIFDLR